MPRQGAKKSRVPPRIPRVPSRLAGRCLQSRRALTRSARTSARAARFRRNRWAVGSLLKHRMEQGVPSREPFKGNMAGTQRRDSCPRFDDGSQRSRVHEMTRWVREIETLVYMGVLGGNPQSDPAQFTRPFSTLGAMLFNGLYPYGDCRSGPRWQRRMAVVSRPAPR